MSLKEFAAEAFYLPQRFAANLLDDPAVVLIYHRVIKLESDPQLLAVEPDNFYRQIEFLKKNYTVLNVEDFSYSINHKKKLPKKSVLITFDDGYADNVISAVPILESLDTQALFFVSTGNLNTMNEMWWDSLDKIFFSGIKLPGNLDINIPERRLIFKTDNKQNTDSAYYALHRLLKFSKKETRDEILRWLFKWAGESPVGRENYRMMTNEELVKMDKSKGAVIGAHTETHTPLSILSYEEQYDDVKKSKDLLESLLKHPVKYFSYPFGARKDYNRDSVRVSRELGFEFTCANFYFQVHGWTNKYELPRALVRNWEFEHFKRQISKFFRY